MKRVSKFEQNKFVYGGWMNFIHPKQRKVVMLNTLEPVEWIVTNYHAGLICLLGGHEEDFIKHVLTGRNFNNVLFGAHHIFIEEDGEMRVLKTRDFYDWPSGMSWLESEEEMQLHAEVAGMKPVLIDPITKEVWSHEFL